MSFNILPIINPFCGYRIMIFNSKHRMFRWKIIIFAGKMWWRGKTNEQMNTTDERSTNPRKRWEILGSKPYINILAVVALMRFEFEITLWKYTKHVSITHSLIQSEIFDRKRRRPTEKKIFTKTLWLWNDTFILCLYCHIESLHLNVRFCMSAT